MVEASCVSDATQSAPEEAALRLALALGLGLELAAGGHDVLTPRRADRRGVAGLVDDVGEGDDGDPGDVGRVVGRAGDDVASLERRQRWTAGRQANSSL